MDERQGTPLLPPRRREEAAGAAVPRAFPGGRRQRRPLPRRLRRLLVAAVGAACIAGSFPLFLVWSEARDERIPVLIVAAPLAAGDVLVPAMIGTTLAAPGQLTVLHDTAANRAALLGRVAVEPVLEGLPLRPEMFAVPEAVAAGDALGVVVRLDVSLAATPLRDGDRALLVAPAVAPTATDQGRPARVLREMRVRGLSDGAMHLFVQPDEWIFYSGLEVLLGGPPQVLPITDEADAAAISAALDAGWLRRWEQLKQAAGAPR